MGNEEGAAPDVTVEEVIAAPAQMLYDLVSDVTRMGEWSPETTSCRWVGGATGPRVGARFRGSNRNGWRRWSTSCTVVTADPGARFSFDVYLPGVAVSRWTYEFVPEGRGTLVRESWTDRRPGWMDRFGKVVRGSATQRRTTGREWRRRWPPCAAMPSRAAIRGEQAPQAPLLSNDGIQALG